MTAVFIKKLSLIFGLVILSFAAQADLKSFGIEEQEVYVRVYSPTQCQYASRIALDFAVVYDVYAFPKDSVTIFESGLETFDSSSKKTEHFANRAATSIEKISNGERVWKIVREDLTLSERGSPLRAQALNFYWQSRLPSGAFVNDVPMIHEGSNVRTHYRAPLQGLGVHCDREKAPWVRLTIE